MGSVRGEIRALIWRGVLTYDRREGDATVLVCRSCDRKVGEHAGDCPIPQLLGVKWVHVDDDPTEHTEGGEKP